jgi:hypothetical protein
MECWSYVLSCGCAIHLSALLRYSSTPILRPAGCFELRGFGSMVEYVGFLALHSQPEPIEREVENWGGIES